MSTDEYVPDEQALEVAWIEFEASADDINVASAEFDRFLTRVKIAAAREALDGLAEQFDSWAEGDAGDVARAYRDTHYPEETPVNDIKEPCCGGTEGMPCDTCPRLQERPVTAHPIDTEALRRLADAAFPREPWAIWEDLTDGGYIHVGNAQGVIPPGEMATPEDSEPNPVAKVYTPELARFIAACDPPTVLALLDALATAEHRATRAEAQSGIRGRAVVMYRNRAREAETRIRDLTQEVRDERGAALDQMEQVAARDKRIGRLENRAASETARANEWRRKHRVMAGKRDAAHRAYVAERGARRAAETRLQAVEDVLDNPIHLVGWHEGVVPAEAIRRALDS